jgi:hypothetical protein
MPAPSQVTATVDSTNNTLAGMSMTNLDPISMLPNCVAVRMVEAFDEMADGTSTVLMDPVDTASAPTNVSRPAAKRATSLLAAEQSKERERKRLKPHGRCELVSVPALMHAAHGCTPALAARLPIADTPDKPLFSTRPVADPFL